jgi:hypothetical protein
MNRSKFSAGLVAVEFKTFTDLTSETNFPAGLKHETAFVATRKDPDRLLADGP